MRLFEGAEQIRLEQAVRVYTNVMCVHTPIIRGSRVDWNRVGRESVYQCHVYTYTARVDEIIRGSRVDQIRVARESVQQSRLDQGGACERIGLYAYMYVTYKI